MTDQRNTSVRRWLKGLFLKRMHRMITCTEFEAFVLSYLDGELPARQRSVFEWHLRLCRECRDYLAAYKRTIELGRAVLGPADDSVPEDVPEDLVKAILDARGR